MARLIDSLNIGSFIKVMNAYLPMAGHHPADPQDLTAVERAAYNELLRIGLHEKTPHSALANFWKTKRKALYPDPAELKQFEALDLESSRRIHEALFRKDPRFLSEREREAYDVHGRLREKMSEAERQGETQQGASEKERFADAHVPTSSTRINATRRSFQQSATCATSDQH